MGNYRSRQECNDGVVTGGILNHMADSKADFTVNNYDVFEYQEGEIYIQTDLGEKMCTDQIRVNQGRVYLRIGDLQRLLAFAMKTKGE